MNIESLRNIKNRSIAQQNELTYLEMEQCAKSIEALPWLNTLLSKFGQSTDSGLLILLSSVPEQVGTLWYGTWLSDTRNFFEFVVFTDKTSGEVLKVESWNKAFPEVSSNIQGVGKTPAYIALELLAKSTQI